MKEVTYVLTPHQELNQADISTLVKSTLRDKLAVVRKAFDKEIKDREAAASKAVRLTVNTISQLLMSKQAISKLQQFFTENPSEEAFCDILDVDGNSKVRFRAVVVVDSI